MNRRIATLGLLLFTLVSLSGATAVRGDDAAPNTLGACAGNPTLFPRDKFWQWKDLYDARVRTVIGQHQTHRQIECAELAEEQPSSALRLLAQQLPPWKDGQTITEGDMATVLIEHLRVYRCAMEEALFKQTDIPDTRGTGVMDIFRRSQALLTAKERIDHEKIAAPKALERTLKILAGSDRLRPLDSALECMARTSLDIRNSLGLTAETAACLPRAWDARTSLRDLEPAPPAQP